MSTPLERAEQAVTEARRSMAFRLPVAQGLVNGRWMAAELDDLVAAVEARYEARLREAGHRCAGVAPADACPLHSPSGVPCGCGHDGGADCHPGARRTT